MQQSKQQSKQQFNRQKKSFLSIDQKKDQKEEDNRDIQQLFEAQNLEFHNSTNSLNHKIQALKTYFSNLQIDNILELFQNRNVICQSSPSEQEGDNSCNTKYQQCQVESKTDFIIKFFLNNNEKWLTDSYLQQKIVLNQFVFVKSQRKKANQVSIKVLQQMKNFEVVEILCQIGKYAKKYTVLNVFEQSWRHNLEEIGFGSYGSIFSCKHHSGEKFAVKCLTFKYFDADSFKTHIKEFFIADLMSAAELGPKILRKSGFDFIIFENCMQFDMELCSNIKKETFEKDLTLNMFQMHKLKVVHCDIKPQNVMYSQTFDKNVLLDFGIAEISDMQIWEEQLSTFRGTYQFCGEQMKKLYSSQKLESINLYLNDSQMLRNSLKYFQSPNKSCAIFEIIQNNSQMSELEITLKNMKQTVMKIKYLIYFYQNNLLESQQFEEQLNELNSIQLEDTHKIRAFEQIYNFISYFNQKYKRMILNKYMWNCKGFQNLWFLIEQQKIQSCRLGQYNSSGSRIIEFYKNINYENHFEQEEIMSAKQNIKNEKQNLEFILLQPGQIEKFNQQQGIQILLKYLSFWLSSLKISIREKQLVANRFRAKFESCISNQNHQFSFCYDQYLPDEQFVRKTCPNLLWVYAYLLNLYMNKELNERISNTLMVIVKDCVILSFNYQYFITKFFRKYLNFLITSKSSLIISKVLTHLCQIVFLTNKHYLISKSQRPLLNEKNARQSLSKLICDLTQYHLQTNAYKDDQQFAQKLNLIAGLHKIIQPRKNITICKYAQVERISQQKEKYIEIMLRQIGKQVQINKSFGNSIIIISKVIRILYYCWLKANPLNKNFPKFLIQQSFQQQKIEDNEFDITKLMQNTVQKKETNSVSLLKYIEQRINCQQISFYFLIPQKLRLNYNNPDKRTMLKICNIIFRQTNVNIAILNFTNYIQIISSKFYFQNLLITNFNYSSYYIEKRKTVFQLLQHFSHNVSCYSEQIYLSLLCYTKVNIFYQVQKLFIAKINTRYLQILQTIFQESVSSRKSHNLMILSGAKILDELYELDYDKFLQFRLDFFKLILEEGISASNINIQQQKLSHKSLIVCQNQQFKSNLTKNQTSLIHSFSERFPFLESNSLVTEESDTYQKIVKMKKIIFDDFLIATYQQIVINSLFIKQQYVELFQFLVSLCIQYYDQQSFQSMKLLICFFTGMRAKMESIPIQEIKKVLLFLNEIQNSPSINSHSLLPLFLLILFHHYFRSEGAKKFKVYFLKTTRILFQFLQSYSKKPSFFKKLDNPFVQQSIKFQLNLVSLIFLDARQNQRKKNILVVKMLKNLTQVEKIDKDTAKRQFDNFFLKFSQTQKCLGQKKMLKSLNKNLMKILLNRFYAQFQYFNEMKAEKSIDRKGQFIYQFYFGKIVDYNVFKRVRETDKLEKYRKQQKKCRQIEAYEQTIKIRKQIEQLEYKMLCLQLYEKKGKLFDEISWIKSLNNN